MLSRAIDHERHGYDLIVKLNLAVTTSNSYYILSVLLSSCLNSLRLF